MEHRMELRPPGAFKSLDEWAAYMTGVVESEFNGVRSWQESHMEADRDEHKEMRDRIADVNAKAKDANERVTAVEKRMIWLVPILSAGGGFGGAFSLKVVPPHVISAVQHFVAGLLA